MNIILTSVLVLAAIMAVIWLTSKLRLNAFISLFLVSIFLAVALVPGDKVVSTLKEGFGSTMASTGFLIIFGAIIGVTLDKTGAILSISNFILSWTGKNRSGHALGMTGFITGLPIFCDSGFIVLSGLVRSFTARSGAPAAFMATVLATSLYSVHCLIPPHPGATAAAGIINADIGKVILLGIACAVPGAAAAFAWSRWISGRGYPVQEVSEGEVIEAREALPPVLLSLLPVAVPLILITIRSAAGLVNGGEETIAGKVIQLSGDPVVALFIGVVLSLLLIREKSMTSFNSLFSAAIEKAGPILIVTAAGGTFGMVIKASGAGEAAGSILAGTGLGLLIPFLTAMALKTAQGSSTVAIITASSLIYPLLGTLGLDSENGRVLATLAMGAGSMVFSHANDSYFWVVTNFSGIDVRSSLRVFSSSTAVMGIVVFIVIGVISLFLL